MFTSLPVKVCQRAEKNPIRFRKRWKIYDLQKNIFSSKYSYGHLECNSDKPFVWQKIEPFSFILQKDKKN